MKNKTPDEATAKPSSLHERLKKANPSHNHPHRSESKRAAAINKILKAK